MENVWNYNIYGPSKAIFANRRFFPDIPLSSLASKKFKEAIEPSGTRIPRAVFEKKPYFHSKKSTTQRPEGGTGISDSGPTYTT